MKLSAPRLIIWWIAVILGGIGVLAYLVTIPVLSGLAFWLVVVGLALLALATAVKGL